MEKYRKLRAEKIHFRMQQMKVFMIQKNFARKFSKNFSFMHRILALSRNNLLLFNNCYSKSIKRISSMKIVLCIQEIYSYKLIINNFENFDLMCKRIQSA